MRVSAPYVVGPEEIAELVRRRLDWVRRQQAKMRERERSQHRDYIDGECFDVWGDPHLLKVMEGGGAPGVAFDPDRVWRDLCG